MITRLVTVAALAGLFGLTLAILIPESSVSAQTTTLPQITDAYFVETRDSEPRFAPAGIKFKTRLMVVFKTDVPLPARTAITVGLNYLGGGSDGCGTNFAVAPRPVDGWYAVDCTQLDQVKAITEVYLTVTSDKYAVKRVDPPPPAE